MPIASPRADFRSLMPVPLDSNDERDHRFQLAKAIHQLQNIVLGHPLQVVSATATYAMVDVDSLVMMNATGGARTVALLSAVGRKGRRVFVKKTDSSSNGVTIDPSGSETIDDSSTIVLTQINALRGMMSDGDNWVLISAIGNAEAL